MSAAAKRPAAKPSHPPFKQMLVEALAELKEPKGSTRQAVSKFICKKYSLEAGPATNTHLKNALKKGMQTNLLKRPKGDEHFADSAQGRFKLGDAKTEKPKKPKAPAKPAPKKKDTKKAGQKKTTKKPASKKPTAKSGKKSPAKKSTAAKTTKKTTTTKKTGGKSAAKKTGKTKKPAAKTKRSAKSPKK